MSTVCRTVTRQQFKRLLHCNTEIVKEYKAYALESVVVMMMMMMVVMVMVMMMTNHQRL